MMKYLWLVILFAFVFQAGAFGDGPKTVQAPPKVMTPEQLKPIEELFIQMAIAREQIVFYSCDVESTLTPNTEVARNPGGYNLRNLNPKRMWMHFEYSKLDGYKLGYIKQDKDSPLHFLSGFDRESEIVFSPEQGIQVGNLRNRSAIHMPFTFDPLGVGLGFWGDFQFNLTFEEIAAAHLGHCNGVSKMEREDLDNGVARIKYQDITIEIDTKRGYWPTRYEFADYSGSVPENVIWEVELQEIKKGVHLPGSATIRYRKTGKGLIEQHMNFHWRSVNERIAVGPEAAKQIASENGVAYEDTRSQPLR